MISAISLIGIFWFVFIAIWFIFAMGAKRSIRNGMWWRVALVRIVIFVVVVVLIQASSARAILSYNGGLFSPVANVIGLILCAAGIAFAVWARVYLGKNWGMPMSLKENPELVTSGPYRLVRHPIYTGMLVAMFGSALVGDTIWFVFLILMGVYFVYSAKAEEKIMAKEFPDQYPEYKKRTKMLIPFIL